MNERIAKVLKACTLSRTTVVITAAVTAALAFYIVADGYSHRGDDMLSFRFLISVVMFSLVLMLCCLSTQVCFRCVCYYTTGQGKLEGFGRVFPPKMDADVPIETAAELEVTFDGDEEELVTPSSKR